MDEILKHGIMFDSFVLVFTSICSHSVLRMFFTLNNLFAFHSH